MAVLPDARHGEDWRFDLLIAKLAAGVVNEDIVEAGVLHAERGERLAEGSG